LGTSWHGTTWLGYELTGTLLTTSYSITKCTIIDSMLNGISIFHFLLSN